MIELQQFEAPQKQSIRETFKFETGPPKVYFLEDAAKIKKPITAYFPQQYRKMVIGRSPKEALFSYDDIKAIFDSAKDELAQEVHDYYKEMVHDAVQKERESHT